MSIEIIQSVRKKMDELVTLQAEVDKKVAAMPAGPAKTKLQAQIKESRGFFQNTIVPLWKKMQEALGESTVTPTAQNKSVWYKPWTWFSGFGAIPLIPVAAVTAATALASYIANAIITERKILSDPSLSAQEKALLLQSASPLSATANFFGQLKWVMLIGLLGIGGYIYMKGKGYGTSREN